jgi:hypothetical protein
MLYAVMLNGGFSSVPSLFDLAQRYGHYRGFCIGTIHAEWDATESRYVVRDVR